MELGQIEYPVKRKFYKIRSENDNTKIFKEVVEYNKVFQDAYRRAIDMCKNEILVHLGVGDKLILKNFMLTNIGGFYKENLDDKIIKSYVIQCLKEYRFTFYEPNPN